MTPEFLEYELRRLPDVVSVGVGESAVTLLVNPNADADALRVVVAGMLAAAGVELDVKVLGGIGGPAVARSRVAPVATGAAIGVGVLAAAVAVAALTGALHLGSPDVHHAQSAARPPAAATPLTTVPNFGPSTTIVPGAPLLGSPTAGATPAGQTGSEAAGAGGPHTAASPQGSPPAGTPGGPGSMTPGPPGSPGTPGSDYVVGAPAVAPPAQWEARADTASDAGAHWAPVTIVPEGAA